MSLNAEWSTFLVALLGALIPMIPIGIGLLRTYVKVLENRMLIEQRPTEGKVELLFHQKLTEAGLNGGANGSPAGSEHRASRADTAD